MATTDDWALAEKYTDLVIPRCVLELRARVAALEAQAAQPAQAEQGPEQGQGAEPLWRRMYSAYLGVRIDANFDDISGELDDWADAMNAVADWMQGIGYHCAASDLRAEAQATREGRRG